MSLALLAAPAVAGDPAVAPGTSASDASAPARPSRDRIRMNERVFDRVWSEVRAQYYDPSLHGVDWNEARRTYRPVALAATAMSASSPIASRPATKIDRPRRIRDLSNRGSSP